VARNIEIKARALDFEAKVQMAASLADRPSVLVEQEDTFFHAVSGRLKLREFGDGTGELIQYHRADTKGPKESTYVRAPTSESVSLKEALANALGVRAVVKKTRRIFFSGQTRIHLDEVAGLGCFIELEVALRPEQSESEGVVIAERLMNQLGIEESHLLPGAYVDLLIENERTNSEESTT
jgi:predicted adenylyl cyclase CyaB